MGAEPSAEAYDGEGDESGSDAEEAEESARQASVSPGAEAADEPPAAEVEPEPPDPGQAAEEPGPRRAGEGSPEPLPAAAASPPAAEEPPPAEKAVPAKASPAAAGAELPQEAVEPEDRDPRLDALGAADDLELPSCEPGFEALQAELYEEEAAAEAVASPRPTEAPAAADQQSPSTSEPPAASRAASEERESRERSRSPVAGQAEEAEQCPAQEAEKAKSVVREVPPPPSPPRRRQRSPEGKASTSPKERPKELPPPPPPPPSPASGRRRRSEGRSASGRRSRSASRRRSWSPRRSRSQRCARRRSASGSRRQRFASPGDEEDEEDEDEDRGRQRRRRSRRRRRGRRSRSWSRSRSSRRSSSWGTITPADSRSRSGSPGRSPRRRRSGSRESAQEDPEATVMRFIPAEAAFLVGKNHGVAVKNIARASNTQAKLSHNNRKLTIAGTERDRARARRYVGFVLAQMDRPVRLDDSHVDEDCSMVQVPDLAAGFVTGTNGAHLRRVEEEWGVVMMFAEYSGRLVQAATGSGPGRRSETLAIFGPRRGRRGAQLTMMNVIEGKVPRYFSSKIRAFGETFHADEVDDEWGTTTQEVREEIMPYALGKNGGTRRKLMLASGCIVQYLGNFAVMSGTKIEQTHASEYLTWLLQTLDGPVHVQNLDTRGDVTALDVPGRIVGFIKGTRRESLSRHEEDWGVLMLFVGEHGQHGFPQQDGIVHLLIFGAERARKGAEIDIMCAMEFKQKGWCTSRLSPKLSDREGFDVERMLLNEVEVSYALGMKGETRKKLAAASGAIIQFVGTVCCIAGERVERMRCKDYLGWLLGRLKGQSTIDTRGRTDVTEIHVRAPNSKAMGVVTGKKGHTLQGVAKETGTWCVVAKDHQGQERLCIFGHIQGSWTGDIGRRKAERLFRSVLKEARAFAEADRKRGKRQRRAAAWKRRGWQSWSGDGNWPPRRGDSRPPRSRSSRSRSSSGGRSGPGAASASRSRSELRRRPPATGRAGGWDAGRW